MNKGTEISFSARTQGTEFADYKLRKKKDFTRKME
jgi:hypothetical protein